MPGATVDRAIVHVDMDAFYASVEQRDDQALRGRPVIVGGHPRRGVVLAASYEVRPFGVRSAMPMAQAVRLAPDAVVVPPRFAAYAAASEQIFALFAEVTPVIEPLSLDEAFLDVTGSTALFGPAAAIAAALRARIASAVGLPASAGIAPVKFAAKVASDLAKPNGQREVPPGTTAAFLAPLPVWRLWGVGPRTEASIAALGLRTIGELAACDPAWLAAQLGNQAEHLIQLARGIDPRAVVPDRDARSIGAEDTFEEDLADPEALRPHLHSQALRVGARLRRAGVVARTLGVKFKYDDFRLVSRRAALPVPTDDGQALYAHALALLARAPLERPVRLTGVVASDLSHGAAQLGLFDDGAKRRRVLNATLDQIAARFGRGAVVPADLLPEGAERDADDDARREVGASRLDARAARRPRG
jgi:DNA polymerase-4